MPTFTEFLQNRRTGIVPTEESGFVQEGPKLKVPSFITKSRDVLKDFGSRLSQFERSASQAAARKGFLGTVKDSTIGYLKGLGRGTTRVVGGLGSFAKGFGQELLFDKSERSPVGAGFTQAAEFSEKVDDMEVFQPSNAVQAFLGGSAEAGVIASPTARLTPGKAIIPEFLLSKTIGRSNEEATVDALLAFGMGKAMEFATGKPTPAEAFEALPDNVKTNLADDLAQVGEFTDQAVVNLNRALDDLSGQRPVLALAEGDLPTRGPEDLGVSPAARSEELPIQEVLRDSKAVEQELEFPSTKFIPQKRQVRKLLKKEAAAVEKKTKEVLSRKFQFDLKKPGELKDISLLGKGFRDVYRNFEEVFSGQNFEKVRREILDPFDASKGRHIDFQQQLLDDLDTNIVRGLGIKKGSKASQLVQELGEKTKTFDDVVKAVGKDQAERIQKAEGWFRAKYDDLLEQTNAIRKAIYPNDPSKIIPKRNDYFRHFTDLSGLGGLKSLFETPAGIDPKLVGVSDFTKPNSKFLSFAQKRLGFRTEVDAVGGYLDYLPSASYAINIDPHVRVFRKLATDLANQTDGTRNVNNFLEFLQDFSNDLAGKTNPYDRSLQKLVGRKTFQVVNWLNSRAKLNVILGNISSSMAQVMNVPQGIGQAKQYILGGARRTLGSVLGDNKPMSKSTFIKERYFDSSFSKFDTGVLQYPKRFASWMITVGDELGTKFTWNSLYEKAKKGLKMSETDAVKYADDITRKMVAGRGVGEVPIGQKAKFTQLVAPFQIEVGNAWWAMKDFVSKKDFAGITVMLLAGHLFNEKIQDIRGSNVSFDPVAAIRDAAGEDKVLAQRIGRIAGEIVSNVPFGQTVAAQFFEKGKTVKVGGVSMTPKQIFGEGDPTRFGGGLLVAKGLQDPLFKIVTPFAGVQIKKSLEGAKAVQEGEVKTKSGNVLGEIVTPEDKIKALLFGKWNTSQAQAEFERLDRASEKRAAVRKRVFDNNISAAVELEKKMREEGLISERSFPIRDAIRASRGFEGSIDSEQNIRKISRLDDETREAFVGSYSEKTQLRIRRELDKLGKIEEPDNLKKFRNLKRFRQLKNQ